MWGTECLVCCWWMVYKFIEWSQYHLLLHENERELKRYLSINAGAVGSAESQSVVLLEVGAGLTDFHRVLSGLPVRGTH